MTISGLDFLPDNGDSGIRRGQNVLIILAGAPITGVFTSIDLPEGIQISRIDVEILDNVGTTLIATLGNSTGTVLGTSQLSAGTGDTQTLFIDADPHELTANTAYWIAINRVAGTLGWAVHKARIF